MVKKSSPLTSTKTLSHLIQFYKRNVQDKDHKENLRCLPDVAITDDRPHNANSVFATFHHFLPILKKDLPSIRHIHYHTNSPTSQYRNVLITTTLLTHVETQSMLHITADWLYFEAGHGKGPCDGVGGVSKRRAEEAINRKQVTVIDCAEYFSGGPRKISLVK